MTKQGMRQIGAESFDLAAAVGGVRGVIESVLPVLVFLGVYLPSNRLPLAAGLALLCATVMLLARLVARTPVTQALGGFGGVAICAAWAWWTGSAEGYFAPGLWINAAYGGAALISVLAGVPLIGIIDGLARGRERATWRAGPKMGRYRWLTLMWASLFALRLAVQWPLYSAGAVGALGAARLIMGVPMFAAATFLSWLLLREDVAPEGSAAR
ncbi:MAG: DUF3159 domain-containing protein [Bowdeniella nasicola]|nr:DUF3159 domain-containing protein [Bowdeniella nasicola]